MKKCSKNLNVLRGFIPATWALLKSDTAWKGTTSSSLTECRGGKGGQSHPPSYKCCVFPVIAYGILQIIF
jgi:hypothetical protein